MASVFTINLITETNSFANGFTRVVITTIWYVVVAISNSQVSARVRMMMMMTTILNADVVDVAIRW